MDASTSALIVAVAGVVGTLASGLLAHRGALRAVSVQLTHAERQWRREHEAQDRREEMAARRAVYIALNQSLRQYHAAVYRDHQARAAGRVEPELTERRAADRRAMREVYAEAQMTVPDEVMEAAGRLFHLLERTNRSVESGDLDGVPERLARGSEWLYEVRQVMRRDLGISDLPVRRPQGYGDV
ncbi:hypothetical protein [Streptomyces radicis]|uniref:Uncharacterized protein n=1 Tax=Streptomyces radicis TaxID=1750517 RepID=A0A3A9WF72_9ACTN|nr:hypothetical protein [Streptomyces radicis]RKN11429.1 hypothetical protein D7319_05655 [Streptomyces radicis]RKN26551.1 hypothetical protein D7318_04005 [Streptomyces radicis]